MVEIKCKTCNKTFIVSEREVRLGIRRYCSPKCVHIGQTGKHKVDRVLFVCLVCNKSKLILPSENKRKKYCSLKCAHKDSQRRFPFKCTLCGKIIYLHKHLIKRRRYCGRECFYKTIKSERDKTGPKQHFELILKYVKLLQDKGYMCMSITNVVPDIIYFKDGKFGAIEIESGVNCPNYNKYEESEIIKYISGVEWIVDGCSELLSST